MLSNCAGRFLSYFPRLSSTSSRKNFNNGTLFPWIPCKIIPKKSPQLHLLTKQKKATIAFWNRLGHDKLTRTGRMNQHFPYLHYTPWKDLTLVRLHVFSTSALLTKLDLATNSWWQRWQLCCLFRRRAKLFPFHVWSNVCLVSFRNEMLFAACFFWMVPTPYIPMSVSFSCGNILKKLSIDTVDPLVR